MKAVKKIKLTKVQQKVKEAIKILQNQGNWRFRRHRISGVLDCCAILGLEGFPKDLRFETSIFPEYKRVSIVKAWASLLRDRLEEDTEESGTSILMATLNTNQLITAEALELLGFNNNGWAVRPHNGEDRTKVAVYTINRHDTIKSIKDL